MSSRLSLIACPAKSPLTEADTDIGLRAIAPAATRLGDPVWLSPDEAWEQEFEGSPDIALNAARSALAGRRLDINVVSAKPWRKRLLVADMDSTLIQQECIDELAAEVGVGDAVAAITERAMRGEIAFEPALRERVGLLRGLPTETVAKVLAERIVLMPGAATLVATMRSFGAHTALVSGGFTMFTAPIAGRLGFHEHRANELIADAGRLSGSVAEPILGREAKADALLELTRRLRLDPAESLAVGDGANDSSMIQLAGLGVAFRAKPTPRAVASAIIDHADLTALLFLQGYRREEFVAEIL